MSSVSFHKKKIANRMRMHVTINGSEYVHRIEEFHGYDRWSRGS